MVTKALTKEHYRTLGLSCAASKLEVKEAYYRLAREHHPDHNYGDPEAAERFKEVQVAYEVLCRQFAKPKPKKPEQFPFVAQDTSRFTMSRLGVLAGCLLLILIGTFWGWSQWQAQWASQDSPHPERNLVLHTSTEAVPNSNNQAQPSSNPSFAFGNAAEERDQSLRSEFNEPFENKVASADDPHGGIIQATYEGFAANQKQSGNSEDQVIRIKSSSEATFTDHEDLVDLDFSALESSNWSPPPANLGSSFPDPTADLDVLDASAWWSYMESVNRSSKKPQRKAKPLNIADSGSMIYEEPPRYSPPVGNNPNFSSYSSASPDTSSSSLNPEYSTHPSAPSFSKYGSRDFGSTFGNNAGGLLKNFPTTTVDPSDHGYDFSFRSKPSLQDYSKQSELVGDLKTSRLSGSSYESVLAPNAPSFKRSLADRTAFERFSGTKTRPSEGKSNYNKGRRPPTIWDQAGDISQPSSRTMSHKPTNEYKPKVSWETPGTRPSEGIGKSWSGPKKTETYGGKRAPWQPDTNPIRQYKKSLQPYTSKAPARHTAGGLTSPLLQAPY